MSHTAILLKRCSEQIDFISPDMFGTSHSMQLIAGSVARQYNRRKKRKGAFWEDRYHATAIETDHHFLQCLVYIDLNMVRAGVVQHPNSQRALCDY